MDLILYFIPLTGLSALLYSYIKNKWINKQSAGTPKMEEISLHIRDGAVAFLKTEYKLKA